MLEKLSYKKTYAYKYKVGYDTYYVMIVYYDHVYHCWLNRNGYGIAFFIGGFDDDYVKDKEEVLSIIENNLLEHIVIYDKEVNGYEQYLEEESSLKD